MKKTPLALTFATLLAASTLSAATLYWDGTGAAGALNAGATANGVSQGNGGTFSASAAVWDNGTAYQTWDPTGNTAVFGATGVGTGGTIILTGFNSTNTTFNGTTSWTLNGDLSGLTGVINVSTGNTNQAKVNYTSGVSNLGATGAVNVNVASGSTWYQAASTGTNVSLTLAGVGNGEGLGAARLDGNITFAGGITLAAAADVGVSGGTTTVSGVVSDGGNNYTLTKVAAGTLNLSGINTFTGNIVVSNGTLAITGAGQLGSGNYAGVITTAAGKTFSYASSATQTLSGTITNAGTFTQSAGTLNLSGAVANSGTLSQSAGTLNLSGTVANSGTIAVSGGAATLSGTVTGTGATTVSGGTLTLDYTTDNTSKLSTGDLSLSGGTLSLTGNAAADTTQTVGSLSLTGTASLSLATQAGRTLTFDNSAGTRSSTGSLNLTSTGSGTGVFKFAGTAANSVLGWATWNGLAFARTDALNQVTAAGQSTANSTASDLSTWTSGATQYATTGAAFTNSVGAGVAIDGVTFQDAAARTVTIGTGNTLTLNGGVIVTSAVGNNVSTITGGTIRGSASGVLNLLNNDTSSSLTITSAIADNGGATGLAKYRPGTAIISGNANAFTGPVTVNGGELQALVTTATGAKSTLGSGAITVNNGSTLRFKTGSTGNAMSFANAINLNGANFYHEDGVMTMSGTVTSTGTSTLNGVWGGKNGIFSNVVVSSGALTLQGSSSDTITALNIASGASFTANQSGVSIGTIAGAGSFSYNSGGNLTITGDNSASGYSGNITFGTSGGVFTVNSGAKLVTSGSFGQSSNKTNTINGTLSVGGNLTIAVGATNTFGGTSGTINVTGPGSYFGLDNGTTVNFTNTGSLNVQQGNVVVGYGNNGNNTLNQSAGTINALGLQLGSSGVTTKTETYALTGGRINLGANGITSVGTGTRTINLGAGTVGAQANWSSSLAIGLTDAVTGTTFNTLDSVDGATGRVITLSTNGLSGTGALVKAGAGTLILSGNNTYTGATTVNAGTLRLSGTNTSAITVNSGGTLSVGSSGNTSQSITLNAGSSLAVDASTSAAFTSNGVNFAGATSLLFNTALTSNATHLVLNYGAGGVTNFSNLSVNARGTLTNDSVNSRITFLAGAAGTRTWNTTSGTWNNMTTANFTGGDSLFSAGDTVVFNNPASASVVTLVGQLAPASVSVTNTNDYTFSGTGSISGASTLTKSGAGKLTINNTNTYTGNTTISANGGTLEIGGAGLLGSGTYGGNIAIGASGTLNVNTTANQTLSGTISGSGALVKNNTGTLSLSGGNNFTGGATINQGIVNLITGSISLRGTITVNSNGTLRLTGGDALGYSNNANSAQFVYLTGGTLNSFAGNQTTSAEFILTGGTINGTANIDLFNNGGKITTLASTAESTISVSSMNLRQNDTVFNIADGDAVRDLVISSNLGNGSAGNHNMIKNGAGAMVLTGADNSFTGTITINTGTLEIGGAGRLGTGSSAQGVSIASGATFKVNSTAAQTLSGVISGSGALVKDNSGALTLSGVNTYSGATTITGGTLEIGGAGQLGSGTYAQGVSIASGATFKANSTAAQTLSGVISGSGALVKDNSGTLTVSNANTYSGGTTVSAGTLAAGNVNALGTGAVTVNGGTLALGANAVANTITVNSGGRLSATGGQSLTGPGALAVTLADGAGLTGTFGVFNSGTSAAKSFDVTGGASFTTLSGQGAFTGGLVTVTGAHNVGNSPGAQTFGSGLTYGSGTTVTLEFDNLIASTGTAGVNWDTITVTGVLNVGSSVNLLWQQYNDVNAVDYAGSGWNSTFTKTLISYDTITGSFNLPSDITITGEGTWHLAQGATSVTATWTAVPEPSTYGLVGAGALAAVAFVRRRRKQLA